MLNRTQSRHAHLSELFVLSLIDNANELTTRELRRRLLLELQEHRDRQRELRFGLTFSESLLEWLIHQSARGLVLIRIAPNDPENARVSVTQRGRQAIQREHADFRRELGFLPG